MTDPSDYSKLVQHAESAVAAVKDPELKRIAFQKILDDLLTSAGDAGAPQAPKTKRARKAASRDTLARRPKTKGGPAAYLTELADEGFFKKPKTIAQAKAELENRGHHIPMTSLSGPLQRLCQTKVLRRQKVKDDGGKKETYSYSNW